MLIFNKTNKYEVSHDGAHSLEETFRNNSLTKLLKKKFKKKKLTASNITFLKSLGFKIKQQ